MVLWQGVWIAKCLALVWLSAAEPFIAGVAESGAETKSLTATVAQRLAAAVDMAVSMATSSAQLAAASRSLAGEGGTDPALTEQGVPLAEPLRMLGAVNSAFHALLQRLRDELGLLFTSGQSNNLEVVLSELSELATVHRATLTEASSKTATWVRGCQAPDAELLYASFDKQHAEHAAMDVELQNLARPIYKLREERASADGRLVGLEELLGRQRGRRPGEEYETARYLGASLFRWELLRTKVAHHLAYTVTTTNEETLKGQHHTVADLEDAEQRLGLLEQRLGHAAESHKSLAERRTTLGRELRASLKSLLLSCVAASGNGASEAAISKRFRVLRDKRLGVGVQAAEEFARFLNSSFGHSLPQTLSMIREVLAPYHMEGDQYRLPNTWKSRPRIGRWWEWLEAEGAGAKRPLAHDEFEARFAAAKRRFSLRVSAHEPVVMAYLLWILFEDELGSSVLDAGGSRTEVLALPSPPPVAETADPAKAETTEATRGRQPPLILE